VLIFDERHQIHVVLAPDDEDALAAVMLGVRVLQGYRADRLARCGRRRSSNPMPRSALSFAFYGSRLVIEVNSARRRERIAKEISKRFGSTATLVELGRVD
jgi:hypothetical protein